MKLTRHKTESIYRRYSSAADRDLRHLEISCRRRCVNAFTGRSCGLAVAKNASSHQSGSARSDTFSSSSVGMTTQRNSRPYWRNSLMRSVLTLEPPIK
jgi:hypothetical protein